MHDYVENIQRKRLSIYDAIEVGDTELWIPSSILEDILDKYLKDFSVKGLPIRTRSKVVKERICSGLGYSIPKSFKKTQPRFLGQNFDVYNQKSTNLQIWNEDLDPTRRYVIIKISQNDIIEKVKVVDGATLAKLDTTGTLTQKFQARLIPEKISKELTVSYDTDRISSLLQKNPFTKRFTKSSTSFPKEDELLPIKEIFDRLQNLKGFHLDALGADQERNRGYGLHCKICELLGYSTASDDGTYPDVTHQLLEVKLQTSPTIDLGLVSPDDLSPLDIPKIANVQIRHCDVRYAIVKALNYIGYLSIEKIYLTTGEKFFSNFPRFEGKILNKKIQMGLPKDFFLS